MLPKSVYTSLESVTSLLNKKDYSNLPEVQKLLTIWENYQPEARNNVDEKRHPFIVLEGLDASGKTSISKCLAEKINGIKTMTPPEIIVELRENFDTHSSVLRRAYYALGNYISAKEVEQLRYKQPVVMDRFWYSTVAYALANEVDKGECVLPAEGDEIYKWPADLLKPDLVFFLNVDENIRNERLSWRNKTTEEEEMLKKKEKFRTALVEVYKRFGEPKMYFADSNKPINAVVEEIIQVYENTFP